MMSKQIVTAGVKKNKETKRPPERWTDEGEKDLKINPLKPELNPICYLLALLGAHHFFPR